MSATQTLEENKQVVRRIYEDYINRGEMDLLPQLIADMKRTMKLKPGETVVFSYIVFKSRAHRDSVNAKVMKEMEKMGDMKDMPFDVKRMVYGGFKSVLEA